jgi:phage/plasmid-associated DNA primase
MEVLRRLLEANRIKKGEPFTHTTRQPSGSYYIDAEDYEQFLKVYCNAVRKGGVPTLTEKPGLYGPLRVDFDMKASLDVGLERQYTIGMVRKIIAFYQEEIRNVVADEDFDEKVLWCVLLEKPKPRVEEGKIKDGFHLHFPHFTCKGWTQDGYLRDKVTTRMIEEKVWKGVNYEGGVDSYIDGGNMSKKQWLMYGSAKSTTAIPFLATRYFGEINLEDDSDGADEIEPESMFEDEMVGLKSSVRYYLPKFLTIRGYSTCKILKDEIEAKENIYTQKKRRVTVAKKRSQEDVLSDIKTIQDGNIMEMLSDDRAEDYSMWMDLGWTLFCIGQGCDEALELWKDFSKRSSKYVEGECEDIWSGMTMKGKTMGSLLMMAKIDSPSEFKAWRESHIKTYIIRSLGEKTPNEWDVAQVFLKMYKDRFLCADAKRDLWYEFRDHRWQELDDAVTIRILFATELSEVYYAYKSAVAEQQRGLGEGAERSKLEDHEKRCMGVVSALKTCKFQDKLLKMCKLLFHDPQFLKRRDENTLLFACENGVLDLDLMLFRDGRPDDYVTLSCGQEYRVYNKDDDEVKELNDFFGKVLVHEGRRNYFLDIVCSCLEGGNIHKVVVICTGDGDNGKSITFKLIATTFGDLGLKFPRELLIVGKGNSSSGARPELARVRGKRWASTQEIAKTETIDIGVFKELTGNDSFYTRGLYEKGTEISPQASLMVQCNEPPRVPGHDEATWNRIRILDFESKFVTPMKLEKYPVPATKEEQYAQKRFHANLDFGRKIPALAPVFLWMLFERYKIVKRNPIAEPKEVRISTSLYRALNDTYLQFIQERIEEVKITKDMKEEEKPFLRLNTLHEEFVTWYTVNNASYAKEKFTKVALEHEFNKRFGLCVTVKKIKGWYGYQITKDEPLDKDQQNLQKIAMSGKPAKETDKPAKVAKEITKATKEVAKVIAAKEIDKKPSKKKSVLIDVVIPSSTKKSTTRCSTKSAKSSKTKTVSIEA